MFSKIRYASGVLATASMACSLQAQEGPKVTPLVTIDQGKLQGLEQDGIDAFLGIPYAKPPVGDLRFKAPQKPDPWKGLWDASSFGAPCMQLYSPSGPNTSDMTTQLQTLFPTAGEAKIDNEDCLFLNVWSPAADTAKRPVMVWFHGGGYDYGSGAWPAYNGRNLAAKGDVVVVTVNHRLNAFGYLDLVGKFGSDFAASGNAGNLDLVRSLEWVRDNIAAFGGDPSNVTIMGESGGGSKVSHLLAMPSAAGLFAKAVIQSGPGVTTGKVAEQQAYSAAILKAAGVDTIEQLRALPADDLIKAIRGIRAADNRLGGGPRFGPEADGVIVPRDPFLPTAPEQSRNLPVLIGYNKDEMTIFMASQPWFGRIDEAGLKAMAAATGMQAAVDAYRVARPDYTPTYLATSAMGARFVQGTYTLADKQSAAGRAPVYVYRLQWETPVGGGYFKSPHTLDLPLMFNNAKIGEALLGSGPEAAKMAEMMSDAWISFAKTGVPSSKLLPKWQPYTSANRAVMELDLDPSIAIDPEKAIRELK